MRESPEPREIKHGRSTEAVTLLTAARAVLENRAVPDAARAILDACKTILGADGLGLISHHDLLGKDLRVAHCDDVACTSATLSNLDSAGTVGAFTSVAVGVDGLGLISYDDDSNDDIKVAHCRDVACTSAIISIVDSAGDFGPGTSLTIGADGLGLVSYSEVTNDNLRVARLPIGY